MNEHCEVKNGGGDYGAQLKRDDQWKVWIECDSFWTLLYQFPVSEIPISNCYRRIFVSFK